ncbi:MAG: COQ9 family protein, partial [Proteobacteria bacterium]|nr:COQ9 family protein [Pseudomonadota bacterium]
DADLVARVFPGGLRDVARHFNEFIDQKMIDAAEKMALADMPVRERIATLVRLRLELLAPHREAVRKVLAYLTLPGNARVALQSTQATVSRMWYAAGDRATDYNYYTKRGLLAGLYSATVLYWLADESENFADTWNFLDRRIENVMAIPKLQGRILKAASRLPSPLRLARRLSTAR